MRAYPLQRYAFKVLAPTRHITLPGHVGCSYAYGAYYQRGVWLKPFGCYGPLTAFDTYGDASRFLDMQGTSERCRIYLCAIELSDEQYVWTLHQRTPLVAMPVGTLLCTRIKCLVRVQIDGKPDRAISEAEALQYIADNKYKLRLTKDVFEQDALEKGGES
jgi:hypothetical protein